eukprot:2098657-Pleurochrysis_carterae.AAC.2
MGRVQRELRAEGDDKQSASAAAPPSATRSSASTHQDLSPPLLRRPGGDRMLEKALADVPGCM